MSSLIRSISTNNSSISYSSHSLHRSSYYKTMFNTTSLPYGKQYNGCSNTLCYTQSKGTSVYKPHSAYGGVGRSSAGYLAQRRRL